MNISKIGRKYALWFSSASLAMLVAVMLSVSAVLWRDAMDLKDTLNKNSREAFEKSQYAVMRNVSEYLRQQIAPHLYQLDIQYINRLINNLRRDMPVKSFLVADATGKVLTDGTVENVSFGNLIDVKGQQFQTAHVLVHKVREGYRAVFTIGMEGYHIGYGEIVFSEDPLLMSLSQQERAVSETLREFTAKFITITLISALVILLATIALSTLLSRTISLPIVKLRDATKKIAAGNLDYRVQIASDDEIGELAGAFNGMVDELRRRKEELAGANSALIRKVEEQAAMEKTLAAEKERLAVTLHSIGEGVISTDTEGGITLMNGTAEKITGWSLSEVQGKTIGDFFQLFHKDTGEAIENPVAAAMASGDFIASPLDACFLDKAGRPVSIGYSCAPIRDREGGAVGTALVFRDVTEKQKMEMEMLKLHKLESVGLLAGGIAHDFNNLLTGILGNISVAKIYADQSRDVHNRLEEAEKAALRARDLTQQLLTFSRGGSPVTKTMSIERLIRDSAEFALRGSNAGISLDIAPELWPVEADESQLNRVIHNLVLNASQAMPTGGTVSIGAENRVINADGALPLAAGRYVKISIQDQGVGIPAEHLAKIFDPYFSTKGKERAAGLGLAISHSIIKNHRGYISVASEVNRGSVFTVYLPASGQECREATEDAGQVFSGKGRILVMDDEEMILDIAGIMLNKLGYAVETARSGDEAVSRYKSALAEDAPFDAVIMDLTIPGGMGGKDAIRHLLAMDKNVKAIVSSGYSNDPVMAHYREYGFCGVINKPYNFQTLSSVIREALNGS